MIRGKIPDKISRNFSSTRHAATLVNRWFPMRAVDGVLWAFWSWNSPPPGGPVYWRSPCNSTGFAALADELSHRVKPADGCVPLSRRSSRWIYCAADMTWRGKAVNWMLVSFGNKCAGWNERTVLRKNGFPYGCSSSMNYRKVKDGSRC